MKIHLMILGTIFLIWIGFSIYGWFAWGYKGGGWIAFDLRDIGIILGGLFFVPFAFLTTTLFWFWQPATLSKGAWIYLMGVFIGIAFLWINLKWNTSLVNGLSNFFKRFYN